MLPAPGEHFSFLRIRIVPGLVDVLSLGRIEEARDIALPVVPNVIAMRECMDIGAGEVLGPYDE